MSSKEHLNFCDDIKKQWFVKRDECFDEFIALNGKNALGKVGFDHIYLISSGKAGLWLTGKQVNKKIKALREKVPSLMVEQLGDVEAVISVPIGDLDDLCKAVRAKKHKNLSESQLRRLKDNIPYLRSKIVPAKKVSKSTKSKIDDVLRLLKNVKPSNDGYRALCPAHDDNKLSLSISAGDDGRVLLHCHAGCTVDAVCVAIEVDIKDLFPENLDQDKRGEAS